MSDSEEIITSDEEQEVASDASITEDEELPSGELVVEESGDESSDESIVIRKRNSNEKIKRRVIITSDEDEDDDVSEKQALTPRTRMSRPGVRSSDTSDSDEYEDEDEDDESDRQALSPRTRMSITGIRPSDLSDSSEIEYSDARSEVAEDSAKSQGTTVREESTMRDSKHESQIVANKNTYLEQSATAVSEEGTFDDSDVEESPEKNNAAKPGIVAKPIKQQHDSVQTNSDCPISSARYSMQFQKVRGESTMRDSKHASQIVANKNKYLEQSATAVSEEGTFDDRDVEESPEKNNAAKPGIVATPIKQQHDSVQTNTDSPISSARYSMQFEKAIKEKLSSTIYQASPIQEYRTKVDSSDESDVQVISVKEKTIEIFSSSGDESNQENISAKANADSYKKGEVVKPTALLAQPKITAQISSAKPNIPKASETGKSVQFVSKEFYDKELKKLQELKTEMQSAQTLLQKIAASLPDGGRQLSLRIERLHKDVLIKSQYLATLKIEDVEQFSAPQPKPVEKKNPLSWDDLSSAVNQMQPTHTGKQGLATFNAQRELTVERLKDIHSSLKSCPTEDVLAEDPVGLRVTLMVHQKHALAWMFWRENQKPRGGILADDMGLGKTLTMISLVLASKNQSEQEEKDESDNDASDLEENENQGWTSKGRRDFYPGGTLVVCPASLVRQWEVEVDSKVKRHKLTVCVHHGNNRDTKPKHLRTYDIVVTTYNIVSREQKNHGALFGIKWERIILDEAHVVRNHKAQMSMAVCELRGKYKWALTGTPIQNKEMDAYALIKFLRCTPFNELAHWKKWIDNKSAGGQQRLNALMKSLMLRRTKVMLQERGELQCLPQKQIQLIEVHLDKDEMNVYQKIMIYSRSLFAQFLLQRAERDTDYMYRQDSNRPTVMQSKDPNGAYYKVHEKFTKLHRGQKDVKSHEILVLLLRLRQICCHPGLIDAMLEDADNAGNMESDSEDEKIDLLEQLNKLAINDSTENRSAEGDQGLKPEEEVIAKASARVLQRDNPVFNLRRPSSKINKVMDILKTRVLNGNDKAIVVSQWTSVLNILKTFLEEQGVKTLSLNGTIPVKNRQEIVTDFNNANSNKRILLLSLTAGGVGLNLVGANHLLMIDLHWNPQLEAQAQDRIYRVGQKKDVIIYKFMCKDTVEERIRALQEHKMSIADGVLTGARSSEGSKLTMEDLRGLFGM